MRPAFTQSITKLVYSFFPKTVWIFDYLADWLFVYLINYLFNIERITGNNSVGILIVCHISSWEE